MPHGFGRWLLKPMGFAITIYGLNIIAWGGNVISFALQRSPANVPPELQWSLFITPNGDWVWLLNPECAFLRHWIRPLPLARPWTLPVVSMASGARENQSTESVGSPRRNPRKLVSKIFRFDPATDDHLEQAPGKWDGGYATPTPSWKLDVVVWGNILNTVFQVCLAVCMWAFNRFDRPSWTTGLFVGLACVAAGIPGIIMWMEKNGSRRRTSILEPYYLFISPILACQARLPKLIHR